MAEGKGTNYAKLALGAGLLAAAAVGVAAFVPRRKLAMVAEPLVGLAKLPIAAAVTAWAGEQSPTVYPQIIDPGGTIVCGQNRLMFSFLDGASVPIAA